MNKAQNVSDKFAIFLSFACIVHCLALPALLISLPFLAAWNLDSEAFHICMVALVIPISLFALTKGVGQHKHYSVLALGVMGLIFLTLAILLEEYGIGEVGEKALTTIGSVLVALGHWFNYRYGKIIKDDSK